MKIVLINPTIREHHPPYNFPAGLGIIAAIMKREGHDVHVCDQNALRISDEDVCRKLGRLEDVDVLGIGGLVPKPVLKNGSIEHVQAITLSLTVDHRVVDGAPGARFLKAVCESLENFEIKATEQAT